MPGRDHTGPEGTGAMTGRKQGDCAKGAKKPFQPLGFGWGGGFRRGGGRRGLGLGRGRGWRFWNRTDDQEEK
jgi:hypothetical protein